MLARNAPAPSAADPQVRAVQLAHEHAEDLIELGGRAGPQRQIPILGRQGGPIQALQRRVVKAPAQRPGRVIELLSCLGGVVDRHLGLKRVRRGAEPLAEHEFGTPLLR